MLTDVIFALEIILTLISQEKAKMAKFKVVTKDDIGSPSHNVTCWVHKTTEKLLSICAETFEKLFETFLTVQFTYMQKNIGSKIWRLHQCHISRDTIHLSIQFKKGLENIYIDDKNTRFRCKIAK